MDIHIATAMTLEKVSKQCEEARDIVDNARVMPDKNTTSSSEKQKVKKTSEEDSTDKEDAMLKVSCHVHVMKNRRFREDSQGEPYSNFNTEYQRARLPDAIHKHLNRSTPKMGWSIFDGTAP